VAGVSFSVRRGEIFGRLGLNGTGKTTTVNCMTGLRWADAGTIVKTHLIHVFQKLGVADRTAAVTVVLERGVISLS